MQRDDDRTADAKVRGVKGHRENGEEAKKVRRMRCPLAKLDSSKRETNDLRCFEDADDDGVVEQAKDVRPPIFIGTAVYAVDPNISNTQDMTTSSAKKIYTLFLEIAPS